MSPKVSDSYKQQKKELILNAAKRAFINKGYETTTMKDIIEEAGLSRGGVYLYFSSTEEAFLEIMKENDRSLITMVHNLSVIDKTVWDSIQNLAEEIKIEMQEIQIGIEPVIFEYFMTSKRDEKVRQLLKERLANALECLIELIKIGIDRKEFMPIFPPEEIAVFLLTFLDGLELNIIYHGTEKVKLDSQINQMLYYLKNVLIRQEGI